MSYFVFRWIKQGLIKSELQQQALQVAGERPTSDAWLVFSKKLLVLIGLLSLAFGVVFFFAFNWNEMGRMVKFMVLQMLLIAAFVGYYFKSNSFWLSQALILVLVIVLGALLALFGQTYQTGADPWQLFATWSMLITPLVLFARSEVLWVVWALLLNTAMGLYIDINHSLFGWLFSSQQLLWAFLSLNVFVLILLEYLSGQSFKPLTVLKLNHRWAAQILGLVVLFILTVIGVEAIWENSDHRGVHFLLYMLLMGGGYFFYRYKAKDLLLLTGWMMAVMVFILTLLAHSVFSNFDAGGLLLMAICLIGMSTWVIRWLKQTHELFQAESLS